MECLFLSLCVRACVCVCVRMGVQVCVALIFSLSLEFQGTQRHFLCIGTDLFEQAENKKVFVNFLQFLSSSRVYSFRKS